MGKMKMGHEPRHKKINVPLQTQAPQESILGGVSQEVFEKAMKEAMEKHGETLQRLAEVEQREKQAPLATMLPECSCKPQMYPGPTRDTKARKHTVLLKQETDEAIQNLDKDMSEVVLELAKLKERVVQAENTIEKLDGYIEILTTQKPEEIQPVIFEQPQETKLDKRLLAIIIVTSLINFALICLK